MRRAAFVLILLMLATIPTASSQSIPGISFDGKCRDYTLTIATESLEGCWDVKVDVPGQVFNPIDSSWGSSFYYVKDLICPPETTAELDIVLDTYDAEVNGTVKLRQGSSIFERDFTIKQQCPPLPGPEWTILVAVIVILIFGYFMVWWWRDRK